MVVRVDGENIGGGKIERAQHNLEGIRQTRGLLDNVINDGMLRRRDESLFEFVETYDSRDAWRQSCRSPSGWSVPQPYPFDQC